MCDPSAASVVARDEIPEVDRGHFEALPCEAQLLIAGWRPDAPELGRRAVSVEHRESPSPSPDSPPRPRYEAARELSLSFPERAEPTMAAFVAHKGVAPSRGHARGLFRPPVARR